MVLVRKRLLTLLFAVAASTGYGYTDLRIVNRVISPDGFNRSAVLAGGTFPGSLIQGQKNGRFQINVRDELTDNSMVRSTSIHWHGILQKTTNWADGTAFVTQCPITPNNSFLYDFQAQNQAGTFWYHSHLSTQYCDGLRGPLVIYDPNDPHRSLYDVDNESTIITLADWYHAPAPSGAGECPPPTSATTLINGKGRYPSGPRVPLSVINVQRGKRYRFRIIAIACDPNFTFSIDGHQFVVIEADGENTQPLLVDELQVFPGQRYSVVLTANKPVANYWIRALPNRGVAGFEGGVNSAILRYAGAPTNADKSTQTNSTRPLQETDLHPLSNPAAPGPPTRAGKDVVALNLVPAWDAAIGKFTVNGAPWITPTVPVMLQILSGARTAKDLLPSGSVYPLPKNRVIEISMPGLDLGGPHPFHLHGHSFSVVRSAGSSVYNYANPLRRDTVSTGLASAGDNVTIRFTTDNSGPWILHCHIDWHLDLGLAVVLAEDTPGTPILDPVPEAWKNLCPAYGAGDPLDKPPPESPNPCLPTRNLPHDAK